MPTSYAKAPMTGTLKSSITNNTIKCFIVATISSQLMMYFSVSFVLWDITWLDRLPDLETHERGKVLVAWFVLSCLTHLLNFIACSALIEEIDK